MSFEAWLNKQAKREDNIGKLSQDWRFDGKPKMEVLVVRCKRSDWAQNAFKEAIKEYFDLLNKQLSEFLASSDSIELSEQICNFLENILSLCQA